MTITKKTTLLAKPLPELMISGRDSETADPRQGSYLRFACPSAPTAINEGDDMTLTWTAEGEAPITKSATLFKASEGDFLICATPFSIAEHWDVGAKGLLTATNGMCAGQRQLT